MESSLVKEELDIQEDDSTAFEDVVNISSDSAGKKLKIFPAFFAYNYKLLNYYLIIINY